MIIDEDIPLDCFLHLPAQQGVPFQLDFETISLNRPDLIALRQSSPEKGAQQQLALNTKTNLGNSSSPLLAVQLSRLVSPVNGTLGRFSIARNHVRTLLSS